MVSGPGNLKRESEGTETEMEENINIEEQKERQTTELLANLDYYLKRQLEVWPEARERYDKLQDIQTRQIASSGLSLQYNPSRIVSTGARIDKETIASRPCFLCRDNRPAEQITMDLGDGFDMLVNPFPILREHYTVTSHTHRPQRLEDCWRKMIEIAAILPSRYMIFYNGPRSGASAPDHLHMQIGTCDGIPLIDKLKSNPMSDNDDVSVIKPFGFPVTVINDTDQEKFQKVLSGMTVLDGEEEPRLNVICVNIGGKVVTIMIPRGRHRPDCYYADDDTKRLVSPGAIDMCGLVITPRQEDYEQLTERDLISIFKEVTPQQPQISVGILSGTGIRFRLNSTYNGPDGETDGEQEAFFKDGKVLFNGNLYDKVILYPADRSATFTIYNVTIGIDFHWERKEEQTFLGQVQLIPGKDKIWIVNRLPVEDYLTSVITSEMSSTAPKEFLKAHAVISRSWVMAQISAARNRDRSAGSTAENPVETDPYNYVKWYDHDQHRLFDVCADDHCQRYQGIGRIENPNAAQAVRETFAETVVYNGHLCDARFSKCCGGISEQFETCWQDTHLPYLTAVKDGGPGADMPDLTDEDEATRWINSTPQAYCSRPSKEILAQVLNDYDQETPDFYRWKVEYSDEEISRIFRQKSGLDIGQITDLKPLKRGPSGRIYQLLVAGTAGKAVLGKELEIRRVLSESHLFSSAFTATHADGRFTLTGAGWGHGVGLCQIGAAVMGSNGYSYREILAHYYPGTVIGRFY